MFGSRISPKIGSTATVSPGVIALVEAGEGVAILPEGSRKLRSDEVVFVPLADNVCIHRPGNRLVFAVRESGPCARFSNSRENAAVSKDSSESTKNDHPRI